VRLSVGLPVESPVGLVRLDALGYPLGPPAEGSGGCTVPGAVAVGGAGPPTVGPLHRLIQLNRLIG